MLKLLHIAKDTANPRIWSAVFRTALAEVGELTLVEDGANLDEAQRTSMIRGCDVVLLGWGAMPLPADIVADRGRLRYVCNITGEMKGWVSPALVDSGLPVSNWGDAPAFAMAEGAMTLLLATLKDLHRHIQLIRGDGWFIDTASTGGSLRGLNVGIYGCGVIGQAFIELIRPFRPMLHVFDPFLAETPAGCSRVASLAELFDVSQAVVVHAGLNPGTRASVTADLLRRLPRHGIIINTARGGVIDQEALFAELASGRLRAGLDVLEPDSLPERHPARTWENCLLTAHQIGRDWPDDGLPPTRLDEMHRICLDNVRRFAAGQPMRFVVDPVTFRRQT